MTTTKELESQAITMRTAKNIKDLNGMCYGCDKLGRECAGSKNKIYSGCIFKGKDTEPSERYYLMAEDYEEPFIVTEDISNRIREQYASSEDAENYTFKEYFNMSPAYFIAFGYHGKRLFKAKGRYYLTSDYTCGQFQIIATDEDAINELYEREV